tara:strand:+ start:400 stop:765 length:366 start_codon:yes stop_codon:yes gene_type:complete
MMRILFVDDSPFERDHTPRELHDQGHQVTHLAESLAGTRFILANLADEFDVVILDVVLPDWEGLDDTRQMVADIQAAGKQVILHTSHDYLEGLQRFHGVRIVPKHNGKLSALTDALAELDT